MSSRSSPSTVRRLASAGLAALLTAAAVPALAETPMVTYPTSRSLGDVAVWIQHDTPLALAQVVDVSPSAVTAVTSAIPTGEPRGFLANISSEATDPQIVGSEGIAAWTIPVEIDCDKRMVRLGAMTGYPNRDLHTAPRQVREADINWVSPIANAPLGSAIRALCDRDFHRPFDSRKVASAKPEPPAGPPPVVQRGLNPTATEDTPPAKAATRKGKAAGKPADAAPPVQLAEAKPAAPSARTDPNASGKAPGRKPVTKPAVIIPPSDGAIATSLDARPAPAAAPSTPPAPAAAPPSEPAATPSAEALEKTPTTKAKPAPKIQPPKGGGTFIVQIGASPNVADTQALLAKFKKQHGADMGGVVGSVVAAQVDGKTVNRALLTGFASNAEANAFCKALEAEKQACFVRR